MQAADVGAIVTLLNFAPSLCLEVDHSEQHQEQDYRDGHTEGPKQNRHRNLHHLWNKCLVIARGSARMFVA
jgi:hypothetical protein